MDNSLDEAESAFLQAVLSGTEAGSGVALRPQAGTYSDVTGVSGPRDAAPHPVDVCADPIAFSPLRGTQTLRPSGNSSPSNGPPALPQSSVPLLPGTYHQQRLNIPAWSASQEPQVSPSPSESLSSPKEGHLLPPPPPPSLLPLAQHKQQHSGSFPAGVQPRRGALSPVHDAAACGSASPSKHARKPDAAACPRPGVPGLPPRSKPSNASTAIAPTTSSTIAARSTSPSARLPPSYSAGVISEVSAASFATTSTSTTSTSHSGRRRRSSSNPGNGPGNGAMRVVAAAACSKGNAGVTRKFLSAGAIPAAASEPMGATASVASGPAGGTSGRPEGGTSPLLLPPSSRRAQGLLQRIRSLEAQLTELLLAEGDLDSCTSGPSHSAAPAPAGSGQQRQQQRHRSSTSLASASSHDAAAGARVHAAAGTTAATAAASRRLVIHSVVEQLCRDYNISGVVLMEAGLDEAAREQLDKALLLAGPGGPLEGRPDKQRELQIVAHNNLACYYRKFRQPALALEHLQHTARLETGAAASSVEASAAGIADGPPLSDPEASGPAGGAEGNRPGVTRSPTAATLLNLAACSSSLGQHMQALAYAARAVQAAAGELQVPLPALEAALLQGLPHAQLWEVLPQLRRACQGATTQLAMAYYNRAVEQEHLHQWRAALESYRLAVDVASRFVGRGDDLTLTMQQSAEAFKVRLRKLERQGKVRAHRNASAGFPNGCASGGGGGGSIGCPTLTTPQPSSLAASCAILPRPHPHLRPLLRCATAMTTSAAGSATHATTTAAAPTAGSAAAAVMVGVPARVGQTSALPAIAPSRPASWTASDHCIVPCAHTISPVTGTSDTRDGTRAPAGPAASSLTARRAQSAGRAAPPGRTGAAAPPPSSGPATMVGWTGPQAPRGGSAGHVFMLSNSPPPAAAAVALATVVDGDTARSPYKCAESSPPLPPKPPQQQVQHQQPEANTNPGRGGSGDVGAGDGRSRGCDGGGEDVQRTTMAARTIGTGSSELPCPAGAGATGTTSLLLPSAGGGLALGASVKPGWRAAELTEEGSLAAMAAAAVAAAAELARMCTAAEDEQSPRQADGHAVLAREHSRGTGRVPEPGKSVLAAHPEQLPPQPVGMEYGGALGGGGDACSKGGMSLVRAALSVGAGAMLAPKRDGVAV